MVIEKTNLESLLDNASQSGSLDLSSLDLGSLPHQLFYSRVMLRGLRELRVDSNNIRQLPEDIGMLTNLEYLSLRANGLTDLPDSIGLLRRLRFLDLSGNRLTYLPHQMGQLNQLEVLRLDGNVLDTVPESIARLTALQDLNLSGNKLSSIPAAVGALENILTLDLRGNLITSVSADLSRLKRLVSLNLADNRLDDIQPPILTLTNLKDLALEYNRLTTVPSGISSLKNLHRLSLNHNLLRSLPPEIAELGQLRELDLNANKIAVLPAEFCRLSLLTALDLDGNNLSSLPISLAPLLRRGLMIRALHNPWPDVLREVLTRGPSATADYLDSLADAGLLFEAKMLLVGEGKVGKTSLLAALRDMPFVRGRPTTHGIEIHHLTLRHATEDSKMILRTWDFGGQEVYRITHQFFFSPRALYILVWNPREGQEQNDVEGWLRRIRLRVGEHATVLIVATYGEERYPELDYPSLESTFPGMLAGHFAVDNESGMGIDELRNAIAEHASKLPQMGQRVSVRWIAARDEILSWADDNPQITFQQFADACLAHGLSDSETWTLAGLMHDLGQIIFYGNDDGLRDVVVLNPEWLTKAISRVLNDRQTREANAGVLDHRRLLEIWGPTLEESGWDRRYHPYFLRLMEKFDISYRLSDDQDKSLIGQLVPYQRPSLAWQQRRLLGVRTLRLVCELGDEAPGLIAWLTVRHHVASTGQHWRNGVFLRHPVAAYDSEALLELVERRQLFVEVRAPSPDLFFHAIIASIDELIVRRWPGLDYELQIPCPTTGPRITCVNRFPLHGLMKLDARGQTTIHCQRCGHEFEIRLLLSGFPKYRYDRNLSVEIVQRQLSEISRRMEQVERIVSDSALDVRNVLKLLSSEAADCPRLFTITPARSGVIRLITFAYEVHELTLWCECPDRWHPVDAATYEVRMPKKWRTTIAPYADLVVRTLQLAVPVAAAAAGLAITDDATTKKIELMKAMVEALPNGMKTTDFDDRSWKQLVNSRAGAHREIRALLLDIDPVQRFGGLQRYVTAEGDFVWICPEHRHLYDPGLPDLPAS